MSGFSLVLIIVLMECSMFVLSAYILGMFFIVHVLKVVLIALLDNSIDPAEKLLVFQFITSPYPLLLLM